MPQKKSLLDDDEDFGGELVAPGKLQVNEEYARRFQHNKEREEQHRLEAKYPHLAARRLSKEQKAAAAEEDDEESSSDEDDVDDEEVLEELAKPDFLEALVRIKKKDPALYNSEVRLFNEEDEDKEEEEEKGKKGKKMTLRQVLAKQALERGSDDEEEDSEEEGGRGREEEDAGRGPERAYDDEQRALREAFIKAASNAANEVEGEVGGILKARARVEEEDEEEEKPSKKKKGKKEEGKKDKDIKKLLDEAFEEENENDRFLRKFILNRGWVEEEEGGEGAGMEDEDEEEVERQEAFEYQYNFRFEDPEGAKLQTFPRKIEGTIRKEESSRKRQREAKAQRQEEQKKQEAEEVKRLKNLKKKEIEERLREMEDVAGPGARADEDALAQLLEGDFDPDQWDAEMAKAFGEDYYGAEDGELPGPPEEELFDEEEEEEEEERPSKMAKVDAAEAARQRQELQRLLGEYHGLDYDENIGGVRTRFRYRQVEPEDYGLSVLDILTLDDKELNRLVGLKKLAPYREDQGKLKDAQLKKIQYHLKTIKREKGIGEEGEEGGRRQWGGKPQGQGFNKKFQQHHNAEEQKPKDRMASYARPTLNTEGGQGQQGEKKKAKKEKKEPEKPANAIQYPAGLSKAQKKNFKRTLKRKEGGGGAAGDS